MTDAHCHVTGGDPSVREFLIGRDFIGVHPWVVRDEGWGMRDEMVMLRERMLENPRLGVGEIGLDRLKDKNISPLMREIFEAQLELAIEFHRPVVLHGAKCWGQVVAAIHNHIPHPTSLIPHPTSLIPSFLFHGFSRSAGLIPDIIALNGYISVGPAILNDHAVNYRELVKKIPSDRLLLETDRTVENAAECPSIVAVATEVAKLRNVSLSELEALTDCNAGKFFP